MSLMPKASDFNPATGGLSPKGWIKLCIVIPILLLFIGIIVYFVIDFNNVADDYVTTSSKREATVTFDSKARFRKQYEVKMEQAANSNSSGTSGSTSTYDPNNIMWAGKPLDFFILELAGEWGDGHFGQKWTEGVPDEYQVPWCANVGWNETPRDVTTGDGGIGPTQATYTVRSWLQQLLTIDSTFWEPISQWANDPSIETSSGKIIGYIEPLNKALMEAAKRDYHQYMNDSFQAWFDHVDGGRPIIETVRAEVRKNGVEFDDLPIYCQAAIWAVAIRISPYGLGNMFSSTDPDTIVSQVSSYCYNKMGGGRWREMPDVAFALRDGQINSYTGEGIANKWQYHGNPGIKWFYDNWTSGGGTSNGSTQLGSQQDDSTSGGAQAGNQNTDISTGDYLQYKQGGGQPWSNDATLGAAGNTIAVNGCAVVSSAIMLNDMGVTTDNPGEVNRKFASVMNAGNMMQFDKIELAYKDELPNGLVYKRVDKRLDLRTAAGLNEAADMIKEEKDAGRYVILQIDYKGGESGDHFIYCTGIENGKVKIADPGYNVDTLPDGYANKDRCVIVSFRIFEKR